MAGHSKWANIKHRKGAQDARRAKVFTKIAREITVAARESGGDPAANPRLRSAIASARSANMPNDRVDKAIKKGTGEGGADTYEQVVYEGYGPGGVAIHVSALTDNRNRTTAEVRHIFSKHGGELGSPNSVAWMFDMKGLVTILRDDGPKEDELFEKALEAGAEDLSSTAETFEIVTAPDALHEVRDRLEAAGVAMDSAEITMIPQNVVPVDDDEKKETLLRLLEALEDNDDVQQVSANCDIGDSSSDA